MGRWVVRGMLGLVLVLGSVLSGWGNTRLGLLVTSDELAIWQARMTDNVTTINGFTYQSIYQNRILAAANIFRVQSHPGGDGYWVGNTSGTCPPDTPAFGPGRASGHAMASAAFVFLLTGNTAYATGVEANLLAMAQLSTLNFANTNLFCIPAGYQNGVETHNWLTRMVVAYSYLLAGGSTGLTAEEKTTIETWLTTGAQWFLNSLHWGSDQGVYSYNGLFDTPPDLTCSASCSPTGDPWYYQGHATAGAGELFNTVSSGSINLAMLTGILTNNTTMIQDAKNWISGFIPLAINNIGATAMFRRWQDCGTPCPGSMWGHTAGVFGPILQAADALARTGDTSLYEVSVPTQVPGSPAGTVSLLTLLRKFARMANSTEPLYAYVGGAQSTELSWDTDVPTTGNYYDFASMAANLYYQDSDITTAMTRTTLGSNDYVAPAGCNDSQCGGCFSGCNSWWPDLPFLYGNLQGQVNPYSLTTSAAPTLSLTTPTTYASITVSGSTLTLSGPASDDVGVASVTWARSNPSGSGSATCNPACGGATPPTSTTWTITDLDLPADGQSTTVTVTVSDGDDPAQTAQVVLTVTRQDTPDTTSNRVLWFQLNDGGGPTAADSSGQSPPNTGTLQGGAQWGSGHVGGGIVLDGVDDAITLPTTLGSPTVLTIAAWVNLSGGTESGTILNIADAVGLRIDDPGGTRRPTTFWFDGSNYQNLVSGTAFPGSGWHHVAMTMSASRQVLYLDGGVVAMGAGVTPSYSMGYTTSAVGRNIVSTSWDLQGTLDDVRVYSRALSEVDMTALVAGEALSIQITTPTSAATYERTTEPLITLSGSAYGTSVTVTWACVGCQTNPSGTASFTPPSWTAANIPLATGSGNVITVTATDGALDTAQDVITVTYSPPQETVASPLRLRLAQ